MQFRDTIPLCALFSLSSEYPASPLKDCLEYTVQCAYSERLHLREALS